MAEKKMRSKEECGWCRFWVISPYDCDIGTCHQRAPLEALTESMFYIWPRTKVNDWCGEFEPSRRLEDGSK